MGADLTNASAVLVAHDVNVSIFRPLWLKSQNILSEEELGGELLISPALIRIPTPRFELLILPDRVQFRPVLLSDQAQADALRVLGGIVSALPHTPFSAIGLNFDYTITPANGSQFRDWNQERFAVPLSLAIVGAEREDARFGLYCSFDVLGMRAKITIGPVASLRTTETVGGADAQVSEAMRGSFNFHRDLVRSPSVSEILDALGRWKDVAAYTERLALNACNDAEDG